MPNGLGAGPKAPRNLLLRLLPAGFTAAQLQFDSEPARKRLQPWTLEPGPGSMRLLSRPDLAGDFTMNRTRHTAEQIIRNLKAALQLIAQGKTVAEVCRVIEVSQPTYHRW